MRNPKIVVLDRSADLLKQVQAVAADLRPRPEIVGCERLGAVGELLTEAGPFDVLIAGPTLGTKAGLSRLQIIHDEIPAMSIVLAFAERPDAHLRDIVRAGAMDLVQMPVSERSLRETLERAVTLRLKQTVIPEPSGAGTEPQGPHGTVFTVSSATGGCGKTFFATNLAYFLHHVTGKRTAIVDLDLQFGEVCTALRLRPKFTIFDALQRDDGDDGDLSSHIDEYTVTHDTGFSVLPAPRDPSDADRIHPQDVSKIIEVLRRRYDYVIVDTPAALTEIVLAAFDLSDSLYVMATLDLPSVRNMGVFLNTLDKLKIPSDNVQLILNKAERDVGIDVNQVTKMFAQGFNSVLPYAREVSKSVNVGTPILAYSPTADVSRRLTEGLLPLLPEDNRLRLTEQQATGRGSWLSRVFRRPGPSSARGAALNPTNS